MLLPPLLFSVAGCGSGNDNRSSADQGRVEKIVFVSSDDGFGGINTISPDGTGRRVVFPGNKTVHTPLPSLPENYVDAPTFSPDGTKIAFLSNREDCGGVGCSSTSGFTWPIRGLQIWLVNADGTGLRQMTQVQEGALPPLSFSPDGSRILYTSQKRGVNLLRSVQINGGVDTVLAQGRENNVGAGANFLHASLSPDGAKVLYVSDRVGDRGVDEFHVYVRNRDGSGETRLTTSPLGYSINPQGEPAPSFSPDGSRILFRRSGYPGGEQLFVMNADGTGETRLTNNTGNIWASSFSPDGTRILFTAYKYTGGTDLRRCLYVMNADGTDQHPVSASDGSGGLTLFSGSTSHYGAWALTPAQ